MTYDDVIDFLYSQLPMFQNSGPGAYKPGLGTAHLLDDAFGNPHLHYPTVHVAGTNGKGSTAHTIASVLQAAGLKVGLYTSPHLIDFRERIRINGQMIEKEEVTKFVERYLAMHLDCKPSFFELTTLMALDHFARHHVDIAVIEVGLGGRLDTTNIISPILSVITNISLDHTALLGNTEVEIAREKAGIIKPLTPVVIGEADAEIREVMMQKAHEMKAPVVFAEDLAVTRRENCYSITPGGNPVAEFELTGEYQHANANTIMAALRLLRRRFPIEDKNIVKGFATVCRSTGLMGRYQTLQEKPIKVICDTGHNIGAWHILGPKLKQEALRKGTLRVVLGFVNDKDVDHIFDELPTEAEYYFVTPSVARGRSGESLLPVAAEKGILRARAFDNVSSGYRQAMNEASEGDMVYVGGSTFVVADLLVAVKL